MMRLSPWFSTPAVSETEPHSDQPAGLGGHVSLQCPGGTGLAHPLPPPEPGGTAPHRADGRTGWGPGSPDEPASLPAFSPLGVRRGVACSVS